MSSAGSIDPQPHAHFPKQAVVVIHGMGEQAPMDTISGFVKAAWMTDSAVSHNHMPDPKEVWSKPDLRTRSLELRRITTRPSTSSENFPKGVRTDFYELYWADLSGGSTLSDVENWIFGLLLRNPLTRVPPVLRSVWLLLVLLSLVIFYLACASLFKSTDSIGGFQPYGWMGPFSPWLGPALGGVLGYLANSLLVPYFGRVVRYTRATPENIAARKAIRERGLALLNALHDGSYERIIVVGHSLGSILGYDLISYFWASRLAAYTVAKDNAKEFPLFRAVEDAVHACKKSASPDNLAVFENARRNLAQTLRRRPAPQQKPIDPATDPRWLITDFVTLGSPLTYADILLTSDLLSFKDRVATDQYPVAPPEQEKLDPDKVPLAQAAGFTLDTEEPQLMSFPLNDTDWQLHHAAPFAVTRWTNIHDPARHIFWGDIISGPLQSLFGPAVIDVDLRPCRGTKATGFTHTKYWDLGENPDDVPAPVIELRKALNLAGNNPPI